MRFRSASMTIMVLKVAGNLLLVFFCFALEKLVEFTP